MVREERNAARRRRLRWKIALARFSQYRLLRRSAIVLDTAVAFTVFLLAYLTAYGYPAALHVPGLVLKAAIFTALAFVTFVVFSLNSRSWRYVSLTDLLEIIKVAFVVMLLYTAGSFVISRGDHVPRSVPVLIVLYMVTGLAAPRIGYRLLMEQLSPLFEIRRPQRGAVQNAMLVGLSDQAENFIRLLRVSRVPRVRVVGILDDVRINRGRTVRGVKVLGSTDQIERALQRLAKRGTSVSELIVAEHSASRRRLLELVEIGTAHGLTVSRLPDMTDTAEITNGKILEPKRIELADLLERPEMKADVEGIERLIKGRNVLITGAGGSIGSELSRQIAGFSPRCMIVTDNSEYHLYKLDTELRDSHPELDLMARIVDVRDAGRVDLIFAEFRPEVVFHAAALKHVPLVEDNPIEAMKTNVLGTRNVADAALANGTLTFIMVSTDKAVNPTNIMGATKRAAESYCQSLDVTSSSTRFKTVRFGNVLGSNGSVVPRFQEQIAAGGPVTVTDPHIVRYFMTIPEAVRLVLQACAHSGLQPSRGSIMVLDMGKPVQIADLAKRMIQLAGFRPGIDIDIVFTGLRPGEKLFEELFDPREVEDMRTDGGFLIARPRLVDKVFLDRTLSRLETVTADEDVTRALELLSTLVPEYSPSSGHSPGGADRKSESTSTIGAQKSQP